jgi:pyruvate dehydrogenase E2 component (dihydrolipoamide acetyltransferase)
MVTKVLMPRLSLTMKEGTVIQWFKKEGETVEKGEPVVEVMSEKVTYEVEAPAAGILRKIVAEDGMDVPVADTLGIITAPDEELPRVVEVTEDRVIASPAAKRLAREHNIDLAQVPGTGSDGRIAEEDVRKFLQDMEPTRQVREVIPLTGIRKTAAERVFTSAQRAPHSTITMEVDMSEAATLHERLQASYTELLVKAVATALTAHPIINSSLENDEIRVFTDVNVGVAVATAKGLIVPVIRNADKQSVAEIASSLKALVGKAKQGELTKEEVTGGTFTITNLGMYGVDVFTPIINPPETAILGVGRVAEKPVVEREKQIVVKPVMKLSLSFDHRVVDGAPAAVFLQKVKMLLEEPASLLH